MDGIALSVPYHPIEGVTHHEDGQFGGSMREFLYLHGLDRLGICNTEEHIVRQLIIVSPPETVIFLLRGEEQQVRSVPTAQIDIVVTHITQHVCRGFVITGNQSQHKISTSHSLENRLMFSLGCGETEFAVERRDDGEAILTLTQVQSLAGRCILRQAEEGQMSQHTSCGQTCTADHEVLSGLHLSTLREGVGPGGTSLVKLLQTRDSICNTRQGEMGIISRIFLNIRIRICQAQQALSRWFVCRLSEMHILPPALCIGPLDLACD